MTAAATATATTRRTLYTADWVLPITAAPIPDGAVLVDGAHIVAVGTAAVLREQASDATRVALGAAVLMPGLVNTHSHLELTALRGFLEGLAFREWLAVLTRARRDCFDADSLLDSACAGLDEALRNGITTCADTAESTAPLAAMRQMGVRGIGYLEVFGPDPAQRDGAIAALMRTARAERAHDTPLVRTGLSPHAPYTVSAPLFRAVADVARAEAWPVAVHIAESQAETRFVRDGEGPFAEGLRARQIAVAPQARSPIALLEQCGLLACAPLLIHAIQVDAEDVAAIAAHNAPVAHCPISNLKLGQGVAPLEQLRAAGVRVGLGTDSVASNDRMDLLGEARQATLLQAMRHGIPDVLSAHEALAMATLGGAEALGIATQVGSLEPGKQADLAAFPLDHVDAQPIHDPAVTLVHVLAGLVPARLVVVAGRERVRDGVVHDTDPTRRARLHALGERLRQWRATYRSA